MMCALILILAALPAWGGTLNCASTKNGNWSDATVWSCGHAPGDGDAASISHAVVLNQNVGTTGGGGIRWIVVIGASASLTSDQAAAYTIKFASTGTNPTGTGTTSNPGDDATCFGFWAARGTLDLRGTQANPLTITTADGTSPVYIRHVYASTTFATFNDATIRFYYTTFNNLGTSTAGFEGINYVGENGGTGTHSIDVQHFKVNAYTRLLSLTTVSPNTTATIRYGDLAGSRNSGANTANIYINTNSIGAVTISDNTDHDATASSFFITTVNRMSGFVIERNALRSTSSFWRALFNQQSNGTSGASTHYIRNNLCYGPGSDLVGTGCITVSPSDAGHVNVGGNILDSSGLIGVLGATSAADIVAENNWVYQRAWIGTHNGQGSIYAGGGILTARNNVLIQERTTTGMALFAWKSSTPTATLIAYNNTIAGVAGGTGSDSAWGIEFGENAAGTFVVNGKGYSNLVTDLNSPCIADSSGGTSGNTFAVDTPPGSGVHHNATYNCPTPYAYYGGAGFRSGSTAHPDALYGDVSTAAPQYVDTTRTSITACDSRLLSGPGTADHFFAELVLRAMGTPTYSGSDLLGDCNTYLRAGWQTQNPALWCSGYNGASIGYKEFCAQGKALLGAVAF